MGLPQDNHLVFKIEGMDCAGEVATLKRELVPLVGGEERLAFDLVRARLTVEPHDVTSTHEIVEAVRRTGMRATVWSESGEFEAPSGFWATYARMLTTWGSGVFAVAGFLSHVLVIGEVAGALGSEGMGVTAGVPLVAIAFYTAGIIAGVWFVALRAWHAARTLRPDMNLLMTIAVVGAVALGEWLEAATVAFLFALSLLLESWSVGRARRAIETLMDLTPATARVRGADGAWIETAPGRVDVGTVFAVRPAERIPLDGVVVRGASAVDQAPITGESVPVSKEIESEVFAGTINGDGMLEIRCTKPAEDTTLARIIRMVEDAQSKRAPSEQWVERFARVYTPVVMGLAVLILLLPPLVLDAAWLDWLYRALVLLVIACPCALVISTPVSIVASLTAAARSGVLIKGGVFVESPSRVRALAIDKTGTLTWGEPSVVGVVAFRDHDESELLARLAALETHSDHPLARAIVAAAQERGLELPIATEFELIRGKGARGRVGDRTYWLGSHRYLEERGQETPEVHAQLNAMQEAGRSVVVVGNEEHVCGFITLADTVRPDTADTLLRLKALGIERIVMLTGDNSGTANVIARKVGVDEAMSELLPADKVAAIEDLVNRFGQVAMVGDGVNDAPALARASLGIAMGAAGSDAAIETADIALMSDDLTKLPWLIGHSQRTVTIIRQNIGFSLVVKAAFVLLTFGGLASLWAAIAADMGASLLVTFNGLRLLVSSKRDDR